MIVAKDACSWYLHRNAWEVQLLCRDIERIDGCRLCSTTVRMILRPVRYILALGNRNAPLDLQPTEQYMEIGLALHKQYFPLQNSTYRNQP